MDRYPVKVPSGVPGSGTSLYLKLIMNANVPAQLPHTVWYNGCKAQLDNPDRFPFRGYFPVGKTFSIRYGGSEDFVDYTFTGQEKNPVFVQDLSDSARKELNIPLSAKPGDKVFNPNFLPYEETSEGTKILNQLPTIALAKSISAWCCQEHGSFYSEEHVLEFIVTLCKMAASPEMMYVLHANHVAWCAHSFTVSGGVVAPDVKKEFYSQNSPDFYIKDIGTIMPSILYTGGLLGLDVRQAIQWLTYDLWDIDKVAEQVVDELQ